MTSVVQVTGDRELVVTPCGAGGCSAAPDSTSCWSRRHPFRPVPISGDGRRWSWAGQWQHGGSMSM